MICLSEVGKYVCVDQINATSRNSRVLGENVVELSFSYSVCYIIAIPTKEKVSAVGEKK